VVSTTDPYGNTLDFSMMSNHKKFMLIKRCPEKSLNVSYVKFLQEVNAEDNLKLSISPLSSISTKLNLVQGQISFFLQENKRKTS
jgi:hypothetical protein